MEIETTKFEASPTYPDVVHPAGSKARVLLTSVFGPYAQDDEYGSRVMNPMELYHNQVTRTQGPFSLRMFHRSWGIMLIQANIEAPCTLLDFPTLDRFLDEIRDKQYDVIGITSIIPNEAQGEEDVRADPPLSAQCPDRHRRPHRQYSQLAGEDRRRLYHPRRGRGLVPPLPGRERRPAHSPSRGQFGSGHAEHGRQGERCARATWPRR